MSRLLFNDMCSVLVDNKISFTVHSPTDSTVVITVTESVNNEQLKVLTELGANMTQGGTFNILASL